MYLRILQQGWQPYTYIQSKTKKQMENCKNGSTDWRRKTESKTEGKTEEEEGGEGGGEEEGGEWLGGGVEKGEKEAYESG